MRTRSVPAALLGLTLSAAPLAAQQARPPAATASKAAPTASKAAPTAAADEPKLVFDREVFSYPGDGRRDPYTPLVGKNDLGPRFEDLSIRGIIFSPSAESMVLLTDGKRTYRKHRGEMVGNARVVQISPTRVIFSVNNFGVWRQESLELKKTSEGAKG